VEKLINERRLPSEACTKHPTASQVPNEHSRARRSNYTCVKAVRRYLSRPGKGPQGHRGWITNSRRSPNPVPSVSRCRHPLSPPSASKRVINNDGTGAARTRQKPASYPPGFCRAIGGHSAKHLRCTVISILTFPSGAGTRHGINIDDRSLLPLAHQ
jgi:hypothetical protein